ncbi:hypothetical protein ACORG1_13330 [Mycobacterium sp. TJFP1]
MSRNDFTYQWAIRLPNGELLTYQPACTHAAHLFGASVPEPKVAVFDDRAEAESALEVCRRQAAQVGITAWAGVIEQRVCSAFSVTDPSAQFAAEVAEWIAQQGGEQR